jgi:hypothetical protein
MKKLLRFNQMDMGLWFEASRLNPLPYQGKRADFQLDLDHDVIRVC